MKKHLTGWLAAIALALLSFAAQAQLAVPIAREVRE